MDFNKQMGKITKQISDAVKSSEGNYDLSEILNNDFISLNTSFSTYEEFILGSPIKINNEISEEELEILDEYVNSNTNFSDWNEMYQHAGQKFAVEQLKKQGFKFK
ncbi:hypothetical protein [Lysinibacillus sp. F5]|uniref:hypothetical protein n=1 Tax=Lysinibacillus sp. F5 TaxID=1700846 RepID=UPI0007387F79|nr:hypothetical protein [Lysinibacillus sp. F5]KUF32852.1 hypothetical protein AK833_11930 [Lysinibacillus sp. F5]